MSVQKSIESTAPPKRIWPFFVEPEKIMQWSVTFKKFEYTSNQHSGVGTPIYIEEQAGGPTMKMNFQITEWKENERIALRMVSGTNIKSYKLDWSIEPTPTGSRVCFIEEVELPYGVIGKLVGRIQEYISAATIDKMLSKLKTLAEA